MGSALYCIHALFVYGCDALVNGVAGIDARTRFEINGGRIVGGLVVCVAEARAPVAEIGGDDEDIRLVGYGSERYGARREP